MNFFMQSPYEILQITDTEDDQTIHQAYLQQVKANPPEQQAERFRLIRQAYEAIKDEKCRAQYALFSVMPIDYEDLIDAALHVKEPKPVEGECLFTLLQEGIEDTLV